MAIDRLPSGAYRVRVFSKGRLVATEYFQRKRDAQVFDRDQKTALASGTWVSPDSGRITVRELVEDRWRPTKADRSPKYLRNLDSAISVHVIPRWGTIPISLVKPSDVQAWASGIARDLSPASAHAAFNPLRQAFGMAVRDRLVSWNPCEGIRLPEARPNDPTPLTVRQVAALVAVLPALRDRLMVQVLAFGGLRFSELAGLRARDVKRDHLYLMHAVTYPKGGGYLLKDLKNHESRPVPLPPSVMADLLAYTRLMAPDVFVFGTSAGTPIERGNWAERVLDPALSRAGLPRITPHAFRDTAASLAIASGADVARVSRLLGHRDASITLKAYTGLFRGGLDDVASRLDALILADQDADR